jgi:hypothetical protein
MRVVATLNFIAWSWLFILFVACTPWDIGLRTTREGALWGIAAIVLVAVLFGSVVVGFRSSRVLVWLLLIASVAPAYGFGRTIIVQLSVGLRYFELLRGAPTARLLVVEALVFVTLPFLWIFCLRSRSQKT